MDFKLLIFRSGSNADAAVIKHSCQWGLQAKKMTDHEDYFISDCPKNTTRSTCYQSRKKILPARHFYYYYYLAESRTNEMRSASGWILKLYLSIYLFGFGTVVFIVYLYRMHYQQTNSFSFCTNFGLSRILCPSIFLLRSFKPGQYFFLRNNAMPAAISYDRKLWRVLITSQCERNTYYAFFVFLLSWSWYL